MTLCAWLGTTAEVTLIRTAAQAVSVMKLWPHPCRAFGQASASLISFSYIGPRWMITLVNASAVLQAAALLTGVCPACPRMFAVGPLPMAASFAH